MASAHHSSSKRPREWRRRVSIRARVRSSDGWADGHIVNISSRGMMLHFSRPLAIGSKLEIRNEGRFVPVTVVWREGTRVGLAAQHRIAVADWIEASGEQAPAARPADPARRVERRKSMRRDGESRELGRKLEYVAVTGFAAAIAMTAAGAAATALLEPLTAAARALG